MSSSLSRGKPLDPGEVGLTREDLPPIAETPEASRFDPHGLWPASMGDRPVELEIGSGKGTFLVQQAAATPHVLFVGIEYARAFWRHAADRLRRHGLDNVRMLHADAGEFVRWYVADATLRQVHLYFPDPWPKKRHHKRRLIQTPFLRELHRVLAPQGMVRIVTDHDDYFAWIDRHVAEVEELFERLPFERPVSAETGEVVGTNFERKYRREGRPFHALALHKR